MKKPLRVLVIEDSEDDAQLLLRALCKDGYEPALTRVATAPELTSALDGHVWDVVISDYRMPQFDGLAALKLVQASGRDLPFILVSGAIGEETAVAAMKAGAHDYLRKDNLSRLVPAVERELREAEERRLRQRAEAALRESHAMLERRVAERTSELRVSNEVLREEIAERKRLETALLETSEREQRRIGQDLHDGLSQHLAGIAFLSQALQVKLKEKSAPEAASASRIDVLVNEAIDHARSLARGLFPVKLESNGLMVALEDLAASVKDLFQIDCRFECPEPVLINHNVTAINLYRIAQEAIHNAFRHGKSKQIVIRLTATEDIATLTVTDNGKGFPKQSEGVRGLGLKIMQYRAKTIGGALEVQPGTQGGTVVSCRAPIRSKL